MAVDLLSPRKRFTTLVLALILFSGIYYLNLFILPKYPSLSASWSYYTRAPVARVIPPRSNNASAVYPLVSNDAPCQLWQSRPVSAWIPQNAKLNVIPPARPIVNANSWRPKFCFAARTYAGNSPDASFFSIDKFIASLQMQTDPNWFLVLIDTDPAKPFSYLYTDLTDWIEENDPLRIKIIRADPAVLDLPWKDLTDGGQLHRRAYLYTDYAIDQCPADSEYLIATNADNWYHPEFLRLSEQSLLEQKAHFVGTDFTSRWIIHMWKMPFENMTCEMFKTHNPTVCNAMVQGRTDLGSMLFSFKRWRSQGLSFGLIMEVCPFAPMYADACTVEHLRKDFDWTAGRVPHLLFSHSPNSWSCILYGGNVLFKTRKDGPPDISCLAPTEPIPKNIDGKPISIVQLDGGLCFQPQSLK